MSDYLDNISRALQEAAEPDYKAFSEGLFQNLPAAPILGVRAQTLNRLARVLGKEPAARAAFMADLPHANHEENLIHAYLINANEEAPATLAEVESFLPFIDNWAVCDALRPRALVWAPDLLAGPLRRWLGSPAPYTVRFGIGMMERFFLDEAFQPDQLLQVAAVPTDHYYVHTMVAWYMATALAKQWAIAYPFIQASTSLAPATRRLALTKACESRRIPPDHKALLNRLRQKPRLLTVAEALRRLKAYAPWQGALVGQPLSFYRGEDRALTVVRFFYENQVIICRLVFGLAGAWADQAVQREDAVGYVAAQDLDRLELRVAKDLPMVIERRRPGEPNRPASPAEEDQLREILTAVLDLFKQGVLKNGPVVLQAPRRFILDQDRVRPTDQPLAPAPAPPRLAPFTLARVRALPETDSYWELFFFYLFSPVADGRQPRAVYLVDLDTGSVEWTDVFIDREEAASPSWQVRLLDRLMSRFIQAGRRPGEIITAQGSLYDQLKADFQAAGIRFDYQEDSYVADDLLAFLRQGPIK